MLTPEEASRGLSFYGSGERLQAVAAKLLAGKPIKVRRGWAGSGAPWGGGREQGLGLGCSQGCTQGLGGWSLVGSVCSCLTRGPVYLRVQSTANWHSVHRGKGKHKPAAYTHMECPWLLALVGLHAGSQRDSWHWCHPPLPLLPLKVL